MHRIAITGLGILAVAGATSAAALPAHRGHRAARAHHARHRPAPPAAPAAAGGFDYGTRVYGQSLPSVSGAYVDPFDPDPIGGPSHVGDGGPGAFLGR